MFKTRERAWSPYASGIVIGLLTVPALLITDTLLEPSAGFLTASGHLLALLGADPHQANNLGAHFDGPRNGWQAALLLGIALGALLSSTLSGCRRQGTAPVWERALGTASPWRRAAVAFLGGFLMLFGAALADGDLVGHGLSGVAQLSLGSLDFLAATAAGGLAAGLLLRRP
jgi:hypothetical protein